MKNIYIHLIAPLAIMAITSCGSKDEKKAAAAPPPTSVNTVTVAEGNALYYDQYQGQIIAVNSVELRSQVPGFITNIYVKDGDMVRAGQPLYEIDRRKYQATYDQAAANVASAQANLVKAQKDIERYQMLLKADAVARQTVDNATAAFEAAKSQVAAAKATLSSAATDLSYSVIKAPFGGRIGISQVKLGAQVATGTTLINTISADNPMAVDVVINEQDIDRFYKLQNSTTDSTFRLKLSNDSTYNKQGRILAIDRGVNAQTASVKVRVQFDNPKGILKDGMSAVLSVLNNQSGTRVIIPYKAITEQMGEFFVFTVQNDTMALQKKVKLGARINANIVIMDGIKAGDKLITEGFQRLRDSGKVVIGGPKQAPAAAQAK
ncbi:efflux RND transporter periplasmic adaptor subunit [Mucilaginibacter myungsuensis]|uniref:Efflux RND transporter periplasmic adaptor subunit n=1 Tax=Mucilaginibacter myungsuensis TaxID=649104 RepID=A0A929KWR9_9SPHI|nr:efflux RND transporter periplasmic adaptor subunit [Mucilaginibacter myungsuensis]MBE9661885.1 efflux RND transporter periplasmic adaptor subunit [Mucilaginibacter myungsuensis]MDN3599681.1 efflux RND transporter periplasmic adaptor subunit [Mucilaginibacter myungsuensis]